MKRAHIPHQELTKVVNDNLDNLVRFVFFRIGNRQDAEDIAHEAVVKLLNANVTNKQSARTYFFKVAYNLCVDRWRNSTVKVPIDEIDEPCVYPEEDAALVEEYNRIDAALSILKEPGKQIVLMRAVDGLTFVEIADIMDAPVTTVQSRYHSAIRELKSLLTTNTETL